MRRLSRQSLKILKLIIDQTVNKQIIIIVTRRSYSLYLLNIIKNEGLRVSACLFEALDFHYMCLYYQIYIIFAFKIEFVCCNIWLANNGFINNGEGTWYIPIQDAAPIFADCTFCIAVHYIRTTVWSFSVSGFGHMMSLHVWFFFSFLSLK